MFKFGKDPEVQFIYWDLRRKGLNQSDIARKFSITRQSVSKSIKVQEREIVIRLLDTAQVSGILPQWYDQRRGVLVGSIPMLGSLRCIVVIDGNNKPELYYDPVANPDKVSAKSSVKFLKMVLRSSFEEADLFEGDFNSIIDDILKLERRG